MPDVGYDGDDFRVFSDEPLVQVQYGEDGIIPGMPLYLAGDSKYYRAINNDSGKHAVAGVAAIAGSEDSWGYMANAQGAILEFGAATLTKDEVYVLSDAAGTIAPIADLTSGQYITLLFIALSTTRAYLNIFATGIQHT